MSGHKHATVTISESEYRHLHDLDMKARFSHLGRREKKTDQDQKENEAIQALARAFDGRQAEFLSYINALDNEVGQIEKETAQALEQRQNDISTQFASMQEDTSLAVNEFMHNISHYVDSSLQKHQNELKALRHHLNDLSGNMASKVELAGYWLSSANTIRDFLETHYDHVHLLPGQIERIDLQMQQAAGNLEAGMPEAALLGAQQAYMDYSQARIEMERLISEWQILIRCALAAMEELYRDISASNYIPAMNTEGNELPFMIDLDHWSAHRYTNLLRSVRSYLERLRTDPHRFTSNELMDLIQKGLPRFRKDFDQIIYEARLEVIYSQIRINIADIAIQALSKQGFIMREHGYAENDMRNPYFISLQDLEGSKVTVLVNPMKNMQAANDLVIDSSDTSTRTESELRSRSLEIFQSLDQFGLQVGPVSTDGGRNDKKTRLPKNFQERSKPYLL